MITVIQRVKHASVTINQQSIAEIGQGIAALVAMENNDTEQEANRLLERILNYRIFSDAEGKMNLSLRECKGGLLLIPQFTLAADTRKGSRPSFSSAANPEQGKRLFEYFLRRAKRNYPFVACGRFGADMQVSLINDGPVTFILQYSNTKN